MNWYAANVIHLIPYCGGHRDVRIGQLLNCVASISTTIVFLVFVASLLLLFQPMAFIHIHLATVQAQVTSWNCVCWNVAAYGIGTKFPDSNDPSIVAPAIYSMELSDNNSKFSSHHTLNLCLHF